MDLESEEVEYNRALLERFEVMTGLNPLDLIEQRNQAQNELFELHHPGFVYRTPWWLELGITPGLSIIVMFCLATINRYASGTFDLNSKDACYLSLFALSLIVLSIRVSGQHRQKHLDVYLKRNRAAEEKYISARDRAAEAATLLSDLAQIWRVLGPKSTSMSTSELNKAAEKWLMNSALGIEAQWKTSPQNFLDGFTGLSHLKKFYDSWQVFKRQELVSVHADNYINRARLVKTALTPS